MRYDPGLRPFSFRWEPAIPPSLADSPKFDRWLPLAAIAGAIAVRLVLIATAPARLDDPDNYLPLAGSLAQGRGLILDGRPSAYRPPLYPLMLAPLVATLKPAHLAQGIAGFHLILGGATVALVAAAARRLGLSLMRSLAATLIVAFDPVLAIQARSVMTETPAAFLVALTLSLLASGTMRGTIAGGVGFGLAGLCRPSLLPAAVLTAGAALAFGPGRPRTRFSRASLLLLATMATLSPWAIRNARLFGEPVWTTTHGGYTLALANNPVYYREVLDGQPGTVWSGENQARWQVEVGRSVAGLPEPEADRRIAASAWSLLRDRPRDFARASLARLGRFWGVAPAGAVYPARLRWATAAWTIPLWIALTAGLFVPGLWRWPRVTLAGPVIALTMVHAFYWTDLRMRAPIVPAIALVAAGAWSPGPGKDRSR